MLHDPIPLPIEERLLMVRSEVLNKLRSADDVTDTLAYSSVLADNKEDETVLSSGGAIMEALAEQNTGVKKSKEFKLPRIKVEPVVVKNNKIVKQPAISLAV